MTLRDTVAKWHSAICLIDENRLTEASQKLLEIQKPSAKIIYNLGCVCMLQQRYQDAIQYFSSSIDQDKYLAIACYQRGICFLEVRRIEKAKLDFLYARSMIHSEGIDYKQLGAEVVLTTTMVVHNSKRDNSVQTSKIIPELDQWIAEVENSTSIRKLDKIQALPVRNCIFQPPKAVVDNLVKQNFLGNAKLISSTTENDIVNACGNKTSSQTNDKAKNRTSSSVPSSPLSSRHQLNASNAKRIFIPPPKRPPPRLPGSITFGQELHFKSRSLEDLISCDHVYDSIKEDIKSVSRPAAMKPNSVNNCSLTTDNLRPSLSLINDSSNRPHVDKYKKDLEMVLPNHGTSQNRGRQLSLTNETSQSIVGRQGENWIGNMPRLQNNSEKHVSSRSAFNQDNQKTNLGQGEDTNLGQGSLTGHAARMRSLFEREQNLGKQLELKIMIDQRSNTENSYRGKDVAQCDNPDVAKSKPDVAQRNRLDATQNKPDIAKNKQDLAHRTRLDIAHNRPDIAQSKPHVPQKNRLDTSQKRPDIAQSKPDVPQRNRLDTAQNNKTDVEHSKIIDLAQKKSIEISHKTTTNIAQTSPTLPLTHPNPQKSPKPVRPPPPKLSQ